MLVMSKNHKSK